MATGTFTATGSSPSGPEGPARKSALVTRIVRGTGWTLISTGLLIMLYLVYLLFFTNLQTEAAQRDLLDRWELEFGSVEDALPGADVDDGPVDPASAGDAYAAIWFEREGERIVHSSTLFVVEGVSVADLRRGPGHYPDTQAPGQPGNFAISGHRTTYGAPFYNLDQLQEGDEIHVVDRNSNHWVYAFDSREIVPPTAVHVIGPDPLGVGGSWMTMTTCHPRFSAAQRMIIYARLVEDPDLSEPEPDGVPTEEPQVDVTAPPDPAVSAPVGEVPALGLTHPLALLTMAVVALSVLFITSRTVFRNRRLVWAWSAGAAAASLVLLILLFTNVFPYIERNISSPTLGS